MYCVYYCCKPQFQHGIGAFILKRYENQRYVIELMVHLPLVDMEVYYYFSTSRALMTDKRIKLMPMVLIWSENLLKVAFG